MRLKYVAKTVTVGASSWLQDQYEEDGGTYLANLAMAVWGAAIGCMSAALFTMLGLEAPPDRRSAVFGLGLGMLWVGGTSWLHDAAGDRRLDERLRHRAIYSETLTF